MIRRGLTYSPTNIVDGADGVRVLRSSNINEDHFVLNDDDVFVDESAVNIDLVHDGDILITAANGSPRLVGKRARISDLPGKTVHGGFMLVASSPCSDFLCASMGSSWYRRFLATGVAGGNGAIGNLDSKALGETIIAVPNDAEIDKLGNFFTRLDSLITLHQRKCQYRSLYGYLSWEQCKLGDVATIVGGGTPSTNNDAYWDGDIDWYSPAELGEQVYADRSVRRITQAGYDSCSATLLPAGKTILFTSRAGIGNTAILRRSACTNQGFQSLVVNDNTDVYFVYSMTDRIKKFAEQKASGSTFLEISGKGLAAGEFAFPSKDEQTAIGFMFKQLDHLITLHQ